MTRAIVWKELREQGTIVAALLVMGCGLIAVLAAVVTPEPGHRALDAVFALGFVAVALLAIAAGVVVGGTLFAGEREAGTFAFLDRLPATRWQLWRRKVAVGLALTAVPAVGYFATTLVTGIVPRLSVLPVLVFGGGTFFGFAWGCVGSVLRRTALGACAVGLSIGVAVLVVAGGFGAVLLLIADAIRPRVDFLIQLVASDATAILGLLLPYSAAFVLPLPLSAWLFSAPDRKQDVPDTRAVITSMSSRFSRVKRFAWLLTRQHRVNVLWLTAAAGVAGCVPLIPDVLFLTAWPALTLVVGVLVGVVLFADEQGTESARFWGERRLRVGGVWGAKLAFGFALTLGLVVLMLVPCLVRVFVTADQGRQVFEQAFRTGIASPGFPFFTLMFVGPVYGLACGQLAALLFRKPVVALAVGTMVGGAAVALWFPSLLGGGLHGWQVWAPVAVTLAMSRLLTWPWATDSLGQRGPVLRLAGGLLAVTLTFAGGVAWRVLEVPEVAEANDDIEFAKSLPSFEQNGSGRDTRRAVAEFGAQSAPHVLTLTDFSTVQRPYVMDELFGMLLQSGYPANRPDIDSLLKILDGEWERTLLEASRKPTGVYIDPAADAFDHNQYRNDTYPVFQRMVTVYALRGLLAQRDGDPADFPQRVGVLLAVVRNTRTSGPPIAVTYANAIEEATFRGVQHWLKALRGRPDLLRQVLTTLLNHERLDTYSPRRAELAAQYGLRNAVNSPASWLPKFLDIGDRQSRGEADVVAFAWAVPWERERLRRAVGYGNVPAVAAGRERNPYLHGAPALWTFEFWRNYPRQIRDDTGRVVALRGCLLQVALRLHEADAGRFPAALTELVPNYLPAVPLDPYAPTPTPFGYRVAVVAESIPVHPQQTVEVNTADQFAAVGGAALMRGTGLSGVTKTVVRELAAGQPIVWSVGRDRQDNGGLASVTGELPATSHLAGDIVFVVPLQAKAKSP